MEPTSKGSFRKSRVKTRISPPYIETKSVAAARATDAGRWDSWFDPRLRRQGYAQHHVNLGNSSLNLPDGPQRRDTTSEVSVRFTNTGFIITSHDRAHS